MSYIYARIADMWLPAGSVTTITIAATEAAGADRLSLADSEASAEEAVEEVSAEAVSAAEAEAAGEPDRTSDIRNESK